MQTTAHIARVVVDVPTRALTEPFDYSVPADLAHVAVGCPVAVPFGGRICVGYVVSLTSSTSFSGTLKPLGSVLGMPLFDVGALDIAEWIADEYVAPLSEALKLFLPPGGAPRAVRGDNGWELTGRQMSVGSDRLVVRDVASTHIPPTRATVQRAVLDALAAGPLSSSELAVEIPGASSAVKALSRAGAVTVIERARYRRPETGSASAPRHVHTSEQADAVEAIRAAVSTGGGVVLLEGVTGSGKTEVYLSAIERAVQAGRGAIVLVPEISLTPQTVGRFRSRLGDDVAVIHSRLSAGERFDQWQLALRGEVRVVVGARSALFAPVADLGLIVIDEEHEPSYKQGQSPRYHTRDVAVRLAAARGAALVLGSATPSMETRHAADQGRFTRVMLTRRVGGGAPSLVEVVDMTAEFAAGHTSIYSRPLIAALTDVVGRQEKAVIFLNRRGFASFLLCRECGHVPGCGSCSVSLTYHDDTATLQCHHCGATHASPPTCPECGSAYLRKFGAGTQRAESDLHALFPQLPVVRMDADTTARKGGHERALALFESHPTAILLGTQMIAKGLDYPDVTLVGVLSADTSMNVPDFRAAERTYQLLEQVAGRAGRGRAPGRVLIQTYWPEHPAVRAVALGDSTELYEAEAADRALLGFPPFGRIANLIVQGVSPGDVRRSVEQLAEAARHALPEGWSVIGPAPAPIARIKGNWRWHLLIKASADSALATHIRRALRAAPEIPGVTRIIDVDPVGML
ncbi:MAG: replication restart helicase PriA [Coriobacteriia bacterium]